MIERFVIFGATGDLTARLLLPSLADLVAEGLAPKQLSVLGVGVEEKSADEFRDHVRERLAEHASEVDEAARNRVVDAIDYAQADVTSAADLSKLVAADDGPVLAYLALPPRLFEPTLEALGGAGLAPGSTVAIEKPFGDGVESARALNELIATGLPGVNVFRVDHFLTNELIGNIVALRFANRMFGPLWSSEHIERIEITWDETLALEGRAGYYDHAGALRDMLQNHLLEVLTFVAMEPPARIEQRFVRDCRAAVLASIPSPPPERLAERSLRARYTAGTVDGREVPSYVDEQGVDPARGTETLAELSLEVENWRWEGVPFRLRSGKALGAKRAEVTVHLRRMPPPAGDPAAPNVINIGLHKPYMSAAINVLGPDRAVVPEELEMWSHGPARPAYANLLLNMLEGETMLSIRGDEAEEAWRIVEPVLAAWSADRVPMHTYAAGSSGPERV